MGASGGTVRCRGCGMAQYRPAWPVSCVHCSRPLTDDNVTATAEDIGRSAPPAADTAHLHEPHRNQDSTAPGVTPTSRRPPQVEARYARERVRPVASEVGSAIAAEGTGASPSLVEPGPPTPEASSSLDSDPAELSAVAARAWDEAVTARRPPYESARAQVLRSAERLVRPRPTRGWLGRHALLFFLLFFFGGPLMLWFLLSQAFPKGFNQWLMIGLYYCILMMFGYLLDRRERRDGESLRKWQLDLEAAADPGLAVLRSRQAILRAGERAAAEAAERARLAELERSERARLAEARQQAADEEAERARRLADLRWDPERNVSVTWEPLGARPGQRSLPRVQAGTRVIVDGDAGEELAGEWLRWLGATDVRVTQRSRDGGVDVEATGVVAQMKAWVNTSVGAPVVQQIAGRAQSGVTGVSRLLPVVLTTSSFTRDAIREADRIGVALLVIDAENARLIAASEVGTLIRTHGLAPN